ncbi:MAG: ArsR family transcriptional regulator [Candidatus Heimdallarchaeaceae archaeon]
MSRNKAVENQNNLNMQKQLTLMNIGNNRNRIINTIFAIFKDPTRRKILQLIKHMKLTADEITSELGISRPAVEKHLKQMLEIGLIERVADTYPTLKYLYSVSTAGLELIANFEDSVNQYITTLIAEYSKKLDNEEQRYVLGMTSRARYEAVKKRYESILRVLSQESESRG